MNVKGKHKQTLAAALKSNVLAECLKIRDEYVALGVTAHPEFKKIEAQIQSLQVGKE